MKNILSISAAIALIALTSCTFADEKKSYNEGINIIPVPAHMELSEGNFKLTKSTAFAISAPDAKPIADFFAEKLKRSTGYSIAVGGDGNIALIIDASMDINNEGYTLEVTPQSVTIKARTPQGLFYGMQTFMQLLPAEVESPTIINNTPWTAPAVKIKDEPRFSYRGVLLDPCRHFIPVENLKKQLDVFALFKINRLHWHLTDDQGWRIEIKQYPKLTQIGAKSNNSEGFYTQEEIKDIVKYAAERYITIIPEIETPGHELAAIAAYPELSCTGEPTTPRLVWGVEDVVLCAGKESTFEFLENVLKEVAPLFPSEYFHIGGDECPKESWKNCPLCRKRIKDLGLKAHDNHTPEELLQSWFIQRMEKIMAAHGKKIIGWDEILEGGLAPTATVMSWRGEEGGIAAASLDHDVIMTPSNSGMYIDQFQGDYRIEPVTIGGFNPISRVYKYNPTPEALLATGKAHHIIGVQCNLWAEYLYNTDIMEYRGYPRILALSEIAWSALDKKDFDDFERRLYNACVRLDGHKINYYIPLPEQPKGSSDFVAFTDKAALEFTSAAPLMVYTTDGSEPTVQSETYKSPIELTKSTVLKIRSVLPSGKMSLTRTITVEKQSYAPASQLEQTTPGLNLQIAYGNFTESSQLDGIKEWKNSVLSKWTQLSNAEPYSNSMRNVKQYAAQASGFINIPEDGIYYFASDNEEVWIDNKLLINNRGEVKRFSHHDKSVALAKGYHPIRVLFLGNILGGWPSNWNNGSVSIRRSDEDKFAVINPEILVH